MRPIARAPVVAGGAVEETLRPVEEEGPNEVPPPVRDPYPQRLVAAHLPVGVPIRRVEADASPAAPNAIDLVLPPVTRPGVPRRPVPPVEDPRAEAGDAGDETLNETGAGAHADAVRLDAAPDTDAGDIPLDLGPQVGQATAAVPGDARRPCGVVAMAVPGPRRPDALRPAPVGQTPPMASLARRGTPRVTAILDATLAVPTVEVGTVVAGVGVDVEVPQTAVGREVAPGADARRGRRGGATGGTGLRPVEGGEGPP